MLRLAPVSSQELWQLPLDIVALGLSLPTHSVAVDAILKRESTRVSDQLGALSDEFRARLTSNLGIESVLCEKNGSSRDRGREAAAQALGAAGIAGKDIGLILDFSTFADDAPGIWSLAHDIQHHISASDALALGTRGSGCCGLHMALRTAQAYFSADSNLRFALLVATDRAPDNGRACLPVSIMSDAASAVVIARAGLAPRRIGLVRAVITQSSGRFSDVISADSATAGISIDAGVFEQQILPLHFVVLSRVFSRALAAAQLNRSDIQAVIYPNTTKLDRRSVARALDFDPRCLLGPGPQHRGHAFANDLLINAQSLFDSVTEAPVHSAWLATGSGFTWGAAIVDATNRC